MGTDRTVDGAPIVAAQKAARAAGAVPEDLIGPAAAAELLACHFTTIYRYVKSGKLQAWKRAGSRLLVSRAAVEKLLEPVMPDGRLSPPPKAASATPSWAKQVLDEMGQKA